jgi:hypothetical protein
MWKTGKNVGRRYVNITNDDGSKTTMTWARFQMLDKVKPGEHVDHADGDKSNDDPANYQCLTISDHGSKHAIHVGKATITCVWCGKEIQKIARRLDHNSKQGKAGPFCGKKCVGFYSAHVRRGGQRLATQPRKPKNLRQYGRVVKQKTQHV